jgi:hypothetical protein
LHRCARVCRTREPPACAAAPLVVRIGTLAALGRLLRIATPSRSASLCTVEA